MEIRIRPLWFKAIFCSLALVINGQAQTQTGENSRSDLTQRHWEHFSYLVQLKNDIAAEYWPDFARQDINCLLPIQHLNEMEEAGEIGSAAESHYSIMGYLPKPDEMLQQSVPAIIQGLKDEQVDVLVLIPS